MRAALLDIHYLYLLQALDREAVDSTPEVAVPRVLAATLADQRTEVA